MVKSKFLAPAFLAISGMLLQLSPQAIAAPQKVSYFIDGDCANYYDEEGEYAFFESELDWTCFITVAVKPTKPARTVRLQYWSGTRWKVETTSKTNTSGRATLEFDPYCSDGAYCDGEYKYRVFVDATSGAKSDNSTNFFINYYPEVIEEEEFVDEDYSDSL